MQSIAIPASNSALRSIHHPAIDLDLLPDSQLLDCAQTSAILRTAEGTLAVWRSVGRYSLPFIKIGHKVFYRAGDLRKFIERRTRLHTGEVV